MRRFFLAAGLFVGGCAASPLTWTDAPDGAAVSHADCSSSDATRSTPDLVDNCGVLGGPCCTAVACDRHGGVCTDDGMCVPKPAPDADTD